MTTQFNRNHHAIARWLITAICICFGAMQAHATILTFDQTRESGVVIPTISGRPVQQDYGDRVAGSPQAVAGGQFTYGIGGEGFTPNILVEYSVEALPSGGVSLWADGYGDLTNVLFGNQHSNVLRVQLLADAGFDAALYGFDLAGWPNTDYLIDSVRVLSGGSVLFTQTGVHVQGDFDGPRHTAFEFAIPLTANQLLIEIDYSNLPGNQQDNIGIDNVRFGQIPPPAAVPEPTTAVLLGMGLLGGFALKSCGGSLRARAGRGK